MAVSGTLRREVAGRVRGPLIGPVGVWIQWVEWLESAER